MPKMLVINFLSHTLFSGEFMYLSLVPTAVVKYVEILVLVLAKLTVTYLKV